MLPEHRALLEDEPCPVPDEMLGEMYRASAHGLNELIATVSPTARSLARHVLLPSRPPCVDWIGDRGDLRERRSADWGGNAGAALFERSREAPPLSPSNGHATGRRKIILATGRD